MQTANDTWGLDDLLDSDEPLLDDLSEGGEAFLPALTPPDDAPTTHSISEWPAQLPVALALGLEDLSTILSRFDITEERFAALAPIPAFRKAVSEAQREVREKGHSFKLKSRMIAEDYLDTLYTELHNPRVGFGLKFDVWKHLVKLAELEPIPVAAQQGNTAQAVNIQINL
ncbi:MAG: hypothetical protein A2Y38_12125 [Spirochaetes bacterium GWB1_59_5]|nr:MAG: hypothetical protein A2Y38_12125 [Spirochaetes bacterium GWB1_59_5]